MNALSNASIVALLGMLVGVAPLSMGIVYALWPTEQRLALMRPLSLAAIFAAVSNTVLGLVNVLVGVGKGRCSSPSPSSARPKRWCRSSSASAA